MQKPLYKCKADACRGKGEDISSWHIGRFQRRKTLSVMPDALVCGLWRIRYDEMDEATLFSTESSSEFFILRVRSNGIVYQFVMEDGGQFWAKELPFPVIREVGEVEAIKLTD